MSNRAFLILAGVWAFLLWLATTPIGAILGFFVGIAIAFFVVPIAYMSGLPEAAILPVGLALAGLYAAFVLFCVVRGIISRVRGQRESARGWWASALSLAAVPLMIYLSGGALAGWV